MKPVTIAFLLVAVLFHGCAQAQPREWTTEEKAWAAAWLAVRAADWAQTREIARNPDRFWEANPLLGRHPTLGQVNRHFIVSTGLGLAVAHYLPEHRKSMFQLWFAIEGAVVLHNLRVGVSIRF